MSKNVFRRTVRLAGGPVMPKSRRKGYPLSHARGARHAPLRLEHVRGFVTSEIRTGRRLDGPGTRWRRRSCARRWLRTIPRPIPEEGPLLLAHGAVRSAPAAWAAVQPRRADRLRGPVHGHSPVGRFPYGKPPSRGESGFHHFFERCLSGGALARCPAGTGGRENPAGKAAEPRLSGEPADRAGRLRRDCPGGRGDWTPGRFGRATPPCSKTA